MKVSLTRASAHLLADLIAGRKNSGPSVGQIVRGVAALRLKPLAHDPADIAAVRTLSTNQLTGSVLVPVEQYPQLIPALSRGGVLRRAGITIVPMPVNQKMEIPVEGTISDDESVYLNDNQQLVSPITPDIKQRELDLKHLVVLFEASKNLARVSKPAFDQACEELLTRKVARAEDFSFFAGKANGPVSLLGRAGTSVRNQAGSVLDYTDITGLMEDATSSEDEIEKFVFFVNGATLNKLRKLKSPGGNYILKAKLTEDGTSYSLLGHKLFTTPAIPNHVGSGSATSYIAFFNPANVFMGDSGIEIDMAADGQYFDSNKIGVRAIAHRDFTIAHPESFCILENVI
jgi:HK97 family phage major capsid protein